MSILFRKDPDLVAKMPNPLNWSDSAWEFIASSNSLVDAYLRGRGLKLCPATAHEILMTAYLIIADIMEEVITNPDLYPILKLYLYEALLDVALQDIVRHQEK